jgi:hypothetical protein
MLQHRTRVNGMIASIVLGLLTVGGLRFFGVNMSTAAGQEKPIVGGQPGVGGQPVIGAQPRAPEVKERFFELRTYTAAPGKLDALHKRFREHTDDLFKKHGMTIIGFWTPADEPRSKDTLIYILAYPDREAREKSWKEFQADPDWIKAKDESEKDGPLLAHPPESVYMRPTDFSPMK